MHGTSGQYRLDMKRDTPRTLMLKMDARLTFAGRERNVALQLEGDREMKHIEWHRQLSQNEFKREERSVRKRKEFFQSLIEDNKARRRTSMKDVNLFETEIEADRTAARRRWSKSLPELPLAVRRKQANLDLAENVGSVRRGQQAFSHNKAHERFLNRSLNELSNSYKRHTTQKDLNEEKLMKIREEMSSVGRPRQIPEETTQIPSSRNGLPKLTVSFGEPTPSRSNGQHQPQQFSLPDLPSRNQLLPKTGRQTRNSTVGQNFYIDTSHSRTVGRRRHDSIQLVTMRNPNAKPKREPKRRVNGCHNDMPLTNQLPSHFYEGVYEENPFLTPEFKPNASRQLVETTKSDNMYAWLGLDSEEELASLRGGDVIGVGKEGTDEMEWLEIESTSDDQSIPDQDNTTVKRPPLRRSSTVKRIYKIGGEDIGKAKANPLVKKFARAAKTIMIVRKLADTVGVIIEDTEAEERKEQSVEQIGVIAEQTDEQKERDGEPAGVISEQKEQSVEQIGVIAEQTDELKEREGEAAGVISEQKEQSGGQMDVIAEKTGDQKEHNEEQVDVNAERTDEQKEQHEGQLAL